MKRRMQRRFMLGAALLVVVIGVLVYWQYRRDMAQSYARVVSGGTVIDTACGPIEYTEFGDGPPMLIVHGSGGGYDQGAYFARVIGGGYRWIAPSRFGFLGSPAPAGAETNRQADAYGCLLDALGIKRVGVVGVSMGGPSSLTFAANYPERTTSLALISAASHAFPPRSGPLAALFDVFLNDFVFWSMVKAAPQVLLVALGVPMAVQEQLSEAETAELHAFLESTVPMGARRTGQLLEQHMSEYDTTPIRTIQAPTLVFHAPDDTLVPMEHGEFTVEHVPGATLVPMEQGGHLALLFNINAAAREELRAFLAQHNPQ